MSNSGSGVDGYDGMTADVIGAVAGMEKEFLADYQELVGSGPGYGMHELSDAEFLYAWFRAHDEDPLLVLALQFMEGGDKEWMRYESLEQRKPELVAQVRSLMLLPQSPKPLGVPLETVMAQSKPIRESRGTIADMAAPVVSETTIKWGEDGKPISMERRAKKQKRVIEYDEHNRPVKATVQLEEAS